MFRFSTGPAPEMETTAAEDTGGNSEGGNAEGGGCADEIGAESKPGDVLDPVLCAVDVGIS